MSDSLRQFIEQVTGESHLRVEQDLGDGFVRLRSEEAERRQAKHDIRKSEDIVIEMLRNSRDALANRIFVASWKDGNVRNLTVIDNGSGIPQSMLEKVFEARVTSKLDSMRMDLWGVHGRGMALYAIKTNADKAEVVCSRKGGGTAIRVQASTDRLGEKRDQSTFPVFTRDDKGVVTVRGPKNINRTVMEFAYIEREECSVYFGSPAEIASALWHQAKESLSQSFTVFCRDYEQVPVCDRLALAATPEEFADIAESLGLPMSSRTARRIMNGEISPAGNAYESLVAPNGKHHQPDLAKHSAEDGLSASSLHARDNSDRTVRLSAEDRARFTEAVRSAFNELARSYYLEPDVQIDVKVGKGKISVCIPICDQKTE